MSLFLGKRLAIDLPPPPIDPKETDRFGLPLWFTLLERVDAREVRIEKTHALVRDATEAVIRQIGRTEARRIFLRALRAPRKGKQPDAKENELLLAAYDRAIARGVPERHAARVAAAEMVTGEEDVESLATQIRRLVKERARRQAEEKARSERPPTTLLGKALRKSEADF